MSLVLASRATVYDRYAISRKFTAQETAINVIQGNISLLISASEIEELKNGDKTMYSKLSAVEMDLNSINLAVSSPPNIFTYITLPLVVIPPTPK